MVQYQWSPNYQQQPQYAFPPQQHQQQQQNVPPQVTIPSGRPPAGSFREESYIENILRLNRGKVGTFHFSFENAMEAGTNVKAVTGMVEAAGRDHVILSEQSTGKRFLFPMIYFDYAEFNEELNYFPQRP
ncbi:spore coat protein GerQ [Sporosarcina aquimarina]|uniref:Spore coat protein GerQ n=1 Tax=Sporosarcina aquimarina TaxID=114975 RepID=A0ABU4FWS0_9BACL|nr:spore coat protein GerQ [Sporosarcina aquimarina]MDW0108587.1 spore coat protein GerQ [Sporosarcina aquimarina]